MCCQESKAKEYVWTVMSKASQTLCDMCSELLPSAGGLSYVAAVMAPQQSHVFSSRRCRACHGAAAAWSAYVIWMRFAGLSPRRSTFKMVTSLCTLGSFFTSRSQMVMKPPCTIWALHTALPHSTMIRTALPRCVQEQLSTSHQPESKSGYSATQGH